MKQNFYISLAAILLMALLFASCTANGEWVARPEVVWPVNAA